MLSNLNDAKKEVFLVLLSILLQLPLALFLGHYFDQRVFMATGYAIASGFDPYMPIELINVFPNPLLNGFVSSIGYPPPWALWLASSYHLTYEFIPNIGLYNFATKVPIVIANIVMAFLVRSILRDLKVEEKKTNAAWIFMLFNPFTLLSTTAWGQIDSIATAFFFMAILQIGSGFKKYNGFLIGASLAIKQIAVSVAPLPLLRPSDSNLRDKLWFITTLLASLLALGLAPFFAMGWRLPHAPDEVMGHFGIAGGMSIFNIVELLQGSQKLPDSLWFLDYLWIPALIIGYYIVYRNPPHSFGDFTCKSLGLTLIFFLTRPWLSEPNLNLVIPLTLIAVALHRVSSRSFHFVWILPIVFMFANNSIPQLFFLVDPKVLDALATFDSQFGSVRLFFRFLITLVWTAVAWRLVFSLLKAKSLNGNFIQQS